jgi:superfamily II DNA or RNA helicase
MNLWPFQADLIEDLRNAFRSGFKAPLLVSPTGSGKTVTFSFLASGISNKGLRTVIIAHRKELLDQISNTLNEFNVHHDLIAPGYKYNPLCLVHVASVFSLVRRMDQVKCPDYVIIDEAHHCAAGTTWEKVISTWRKANPRLRIVGVTATPQRLSGEGLDHVFDTMVMGPTVSELIKDRYLAPYRMFAPPEPVDTSMLHRRMGDFVRGEAVELMDKPKIMGDAISHYKKHLNGAPCVGFCITVDHAGNVAENYRANGFQATAISGKTPKAERDMIIRDFGRGRINYLSSCDLISEGLDIPGMMGCQNLRPTESLALCLQQWGRTLRYVDGKTAIILDHVANSQRLQTLPDTVHAWSLAGQPKKKGKRDPDDIAIRQCGFCGAVCSGGSTYCDECGNEFPVKLRSIKEVEGELEEVRKVEQKAARMQQGRAGDMAALIELGKMRGMKNPRGWAWHVYNARKNKRKTANG